ncbi:hypothetical [Prochlorococcus marinus str. MIT 9313]|uniref:Uncharacterized protein n=1 Tax=Prochlorococcus marinus (strain MIT 9313) TaxID=74547 RepID=Q7V775_PROMM|nr:hypothetical [Prochlorococcus marinus str. MIT 9313]
MKSAVVADLRFARRSVRIDACSCGALKLHYSSSMPKRSLASQISFSCNSLVMFGIKAKTRCCVVDTFNLHAVASTNVGKT